MDTMPADRPQLELGAQVKVIYRGRDAQGSVIHNLEAPTVWKPDRRYGEEAPEWDGPVHVGFTLDNEFIEADFDPTEVTLVEHPAPPLMTTEAVPLLGRVCRFWYRDHQMSKGEGIPVIGKVVLPWAPSEQEGSQFRRGGPFWFVVDRHGERLMEYYLRDPEPHEGWPEEESEIRFGHGGQELIPLMVEQAAEVISQVCEFDNTAGAGDGPLVARVVMPWIPRTPYEERLWMSGHLWFVQLLDGTLSARSGLSLGRMLEGWPGGAHAPNHPCPTRLGPAVPQATPESPEQLLAALTAEADDTLGRLRQAGMVPGGYRLERGTVTGWPIEAVVFLWDAPVQPGGYDRLELGDDGSARYFRGQPQQYHREGGPAVEGYDGERAWMVDGDYHREDGPAVERPSGGFQWYLHGEMHRVGGPAVKKDYGDLVWMRHGRPHRLDGPAREEKLRAGSSWAVAGQWLGEEEFDSHPAVVAFRAGVPEEFVMDAVASGSDDAEDIIRRWRADQI